MQIRTGHACTGLGLIAHQKRRVQAYISLSFSSDIDIGTKYTDSEYPVLLLLNMQVVWYNLGNVGQWIARESNTKKLTETKTHKNAILTLQLNTHTQLNSMKRDTKAAHQIYVRTRWAIERRTKKCTVTIIVMY